jgi:hypothetical protein
MPIADDAANFKAWYVDVLHGLYKIEGAGIPVLMISMPLLERYLRQKNRIAPADALTDASMRDLCVMFPALPSVDIARQFWNVYRHGFLHQATLSTVSHRGANLPVGWLTYNRSAAVSIESNGSFCVEPRLFAQTVVAAIQADFPTFAGVAAGAPPLPVVARLDPFPIPSAYLGTRGGP